MIRAAVVTFCACAVLLAGCGGRDHKRSPSTETAMKQPKSDAVKSRYATAAGRGTAAKVVSSQYGRLVADGRGQAFYLLGKEHAKQSQCYRECANKWPPVLANSNPHAGRSADSRLLGTTQRRDRKLQLTYADHPLYYYRGDSPGRVLFQGVNGFGGIWLVVRPDGKPAQ